MRRLVIGCGVNGALSLWHRMCLFQVSAFLQRGRPQNLGVCSVSVPMTFPKEPEEPRNPLEGEQC